MAYTVPFPDYPYGVEYYVTMAEKAGVASPLFSKIMRLSEDCLGRESKNEFISFYCSVYPDFPRQMKGAMDFMPRVTSSAVENVQVADDRSYGPSANDDREEDTDEDRRADIARVRQEAGLLGFALIPLSQASKCSVSGGRKSRRKSNRKNRSRR